MIKVQIIQRTYPHQSYGFREEDEVYVDGKLIGGGCYCGEPEDNRRCRTYYWVPVTLQALAEALGAEVEIVERSEDTDNI